MKEKNTEMSLVDSNQELKTPEDYDDLFDKKSDKVFKKIDKDVKSLIELTNEISINSSNNNYSSLFDKVKEIKSLIGKIENDLSVHENQINVDFPKFNFFFKFIAVLGFIFGRLKEESFNYIFKSSKDLRDFHIQVNRNFHSTLDKQREQLELTISSFLKENNKEYQETLKAIDKIKNDLLLLNHNEDSIFNIAKSYDFKIYKDGFGTVSPYELKELKNFLSKKVISLETKKEEMQNNFKK